jgi:hypothetical protein
MLHPFDIWDTYDMTSSKDEISGRLLVKGAATDASASDKEIPISAVLSAGASFAPSPVNPLHDYRSKPEPCTRSFGVLTQYTRDSEDAEPVLLSRLGTFWQR